MVKRFISTLVLVVALVGSVSAQNLDDLSKKVFDLSFEAINKGMNAYEEQLEKQELEEAKKDLEEINKNIEKVKKILEETKKIEEETKKIEEETKKLKEENFEAEEAEESNFEENCNILYDVAIGYLLEHDAWVKCYCDPVGDYIWYTIFYGDDNNLWINLAYDSNGSKGETFYSTKIESSAYLNFKDDISGKEYAAIRLNYIIILQDVHNPRVFKMSW